MILQPIQEVSNTMSLEHYRRKKSTLLANQLKLTSQKLRNYMGDSFKVTLQMVRIHSSLVSRSKKKIKQETRLVPEKIRKYSVSDASITTHSFNLSIIQQV